MAHKTPIEKFKASELTGLYRELSMSSYDTWQAAVIVSQFLTGRGYGTCMQSVRHSVLSMECTSNLERIQEELEKLAYIM